MATLVLVHGLFGHLNYPELHDEFTSTTVLAPDLIGYGVHRNKTTESVRLEDQADHVIEYIESHCTSPVHLLGHSVGGAVCMLVAHRRPDMLDSVISVEGNFTLDDAFWSQKIAETDDDEVEEIIRGYSEAPDKWIEGAVRRMSPLASRLAAEWLAHQPASTIKAQSRAVVASTGAAEYLDMCRSVVESGLSVGLIAGSESAADWHVPLWVNQLCSYRINQPDSGHLMMVDSPYQFANAVAGGIALCASD